MKIAKVVGRGHLLPAFYGVAWVRYDTDAVVCLPVPFNLAAALLRASWVFLRHGLRPVYANPREAFYQGVQVGKQQKASKEQP